jgi:protein-L-isoaspartate(D-aspartate) O-methyltransferase
MLELLGVREGMKVLDVGTGSGWTTALLSSLVGSTGMVFGREIVPELVLMGRRHLATVGAGNATIEEAGSVLGAPEHGPFDRILVSAVTSELPDDLVLQLAGGGRMVIPVGGELLLVEKDESGHVAISEHGPFVFVPLIEDRNRRGWGDTKDVL